MLRTIQNNSTVYHFFPQWNHNTVTNNKNTFQAVYHFFLQWNQNGLMTLLLKEKLIFFPKRNCNATYILCVRSKCFLLILKRNHNIIGFFIVCGSHVYYFSSMESKYSKF
jgi:hypothetical protein